MIDPFKAQLIKELIEKMTDLGNDLSIQHGETMDFSDIAFICTLATIHVLSTFAFSRLNQEGIDGSAEMLEKIILQLRDSANDAIEDRKRELLESGEGRPETDHKIEDPWK